MKREYKIWILVIIIEICCMSILGEMRVSIHSLLGKVVGIILIFGPITKILYMLSKDAAISLKKEIYQK